MSIGVAGEENVWCVLVLVMLAVVLVMMGCARWCIRLGGCKLGEENVSEICMGAKCYYWGVQLTLVGR